MWGALLGTLGGAYLGYKGTQQQNIASAEQAEKQMAFQERMSNTAHQRQMADLRKAGLNPILSAKYGGASTPPGQQAPMFNKAALALQNATSAANIQNIMANTAKTLAETAAVGPTAVLGLGGASQAATALSSAKDMVRSYGGLSNMKTPTVPNILQAAQPSNIFMKTAAAIIREMKIPYSEKHPAAIRANLRFGRKSAHHKRLIKSIQSKHPRNQRRGR